MLKLDKETVKEQHDLSTGSLFPGKQLNYENIFFCVVSTLLLWELGFMITETDKNMVLRLIAVYLFCFCIF